MRIRIALTTFCLFSLAHAHYPEEVAVLGDNYSDSGNSRPSTFGTPPTTAFTPLTDGTTWPVMLAEKLEAKKLLPSIQGGTNYAYVGALTDGTNPAFSNPSLTDQMRALHTDKNNPIFILGGINDILNSLATGAEAAVNISNILDDLHHRHYHTLIVLNLPDVGKFPAAGASTSAFTANTLEFNATLLDELQDKHYPVIGIDLYSLYEKLLADPEDFGLDNSTSATPLDSPTSGYVFWYDGIDPTEATHRIISDYVFSVLGGAQCYSTLAVVPFGMLRQQRTNIYQQLAPMQHYHDKFILYPFISGGYTPLLLPPVSDSCDGRSAHGGNVTGGFTMHIWGGWTIGAAGTYSTLLSKCHEQRNHCEFDLDAGILSLFAACNRDHGYLNGIFNAAWLNYDSVKRKFYSGSYDNHTHGKTSGMDYDAEMYGTYYLWSYPQTKIIARSHFRTGPMFDMNYQRVFVDGFKESGAKFGNLEYKDQDNSLFATGLGWEAILDFNFLNLGVLMDFTLAANRQWLGHGREIHFHERSMPHTKGSWQVRSQKNTYASGGLDMSFIHPSGATFSLGYSFNIGTVHMSEQFLTAGLTFPLGKKKPPQQQVKIIQHEGL